MTRATRTSVQLWPSQIALLDRYAAACGTSRSDALRHIIGQWQAIQALVDARMARLELRKLNKSKPDT
jgi:hypothetical protein